MYFCIDEFEVGINDSTLFSGNEQQEGVISPVILCNITFSGDK